jgi:putative N6-adenine-specific DNA methylase
MDNHQFFAVCAPGLEPVTAAELSALKLISPEAASHITAGSGGVDFDGDERAMYLANYFLRSANRILMRFGQFHATKFVELRRKVSNLPWKTVLKPGQKVQIKVTCHASRLYHSGAVAQRTLEGIGDCTGFEPDLVKGEITEENVLSILVRFVKDECTISLDTSGAGLDRRGYRLALGKAPLRETLAAGILLASGWQPGQPLMDPFCGSGVIPIEAAMIAAHIAPGRNRHFPFMDWSDFKPKMMQTIIQYAEQDTRPPAALLYGSDRDAGVIEMARQNAERAGVSRWIQFDHKPVSALTAPRFPGWIVTNPPYGVRVSSNADLRNLYASFGKLLNEQFSGWGVAFLCTDDHLATLTHLNFDKGLSLNNGGIAVKLNRGHVPA